MQSPSIMFKQDGSYSHPHPPVYPSARSSSPCTLSEIFLCVCTIYYNPINLTPKERPKRTPLRFDSLSLSLSLLRHVGRCASTCVMERKAIPSPTDSEVVHSSVLSPARLPFPLLPPPLQRSVAAPKAVDYGGGPLRRVRPFGVRSCYDRRLI